MPPPDSFIRGHPPLWKCIASFSALDGAIGVCLELMGHIWAGPFLCPSLCISLCELQMEQLGCLPLARCCNVLPGFPLWDPGMVFPDRVWM